MTGTLHDRVAIVTGGGKGLGRAFALHLAHLGAAVVVNNRNRIVDADGRSAADHVVDEIVAEGGRAVANYGDVSDPATAEALVAAALDTWGRLDICVTSAAVNSPQMFHSTTADHFARVMAINVTGTALVASAAMKVMRAAGHGRIIMVASTAGLHGEATVSAYAASKGAVIALGRTAAAEGERRGVLTNVLLPYAATQMTEGGMEPVLAASLTSESVAPVVGALADPGLEINGQVIVAAGSAVRAVDSVEYGTVTYPDPTFLAGSDLAQLLADSRSGQVHTYDHARHAFENLASELVELPKKDPS